MSARRFPATKRRLREAREAGEAPSSAVLTGAAALLAGFVALGTGAADGLSALTEFSRYCLSGVGDGDLPSTLGSLGRVLSQVLWPVLLATFSMVAFVLVLQVGPAFSLKSLAPSARKQPLSGALRRVFGLAAAGRALRAFGLVVALLTVGGVGLIPAVSGLTPAPIAGLGPAVGAVVETLIGLISGLLMLGFVAGVGDYSWSRHRLAKRLMMTHTERERERRETEGDPVFRAQRWKLAREWRERALDQGPDTLVFCVVGELTAVVLAHRLNGTQDRAPVVVRIGREGVADRLVQTCRERRLPVVRDLELANALASLSPGAPVPRAHYGAVAAHIVAVS